MYDNLIILLAKNLFPINLNDLRPAPLWLDVMTLALRLCNSLIRNIDVSLYIDDTPKMLTIRILFYFGFINARLYYFGSCLGNCHSGGR